MADFIRTVTGDISPLELGYCQCHEHLLLAKGKSYTIDPSLYMDDEKKSADELLSYYAAGGRALVDAQPVGCGRMADGLRRISEASGVKIIASTGFHKLLFYPEDHVVYRSSAEELAELFAGELMLGMFVDHVNGEAPFTERGAAKAGIIKTASDGRDITSGEDVLPIYRKLFTAAAMAAGANIWAAFFGTEGIFTVLDRVISFVICWLVIKVIPERTLVKFGCGSNYIKEKK